MPSPHAFIGGATGSGKSTVLRTLLLPAAPRALILDQMGDPAWEQVADHPVVTTTSAAIRALGGGARRVVLTVNDPDLLADGSVLGSIIPTSWPTDRYLDPSSDLAPER